MTIYYNFTNNQTELEVTSWNGNYAGNVVIPESVTYEGNTYSVTSIGEGAFFDCSGLTELTIPGSVTSIGNSAFQYCSGLTELTIPGSVTSIGNSAFQYCSGLTEVTISDGEGVLSLSSAFFDCPIETLYLGRTVSDTPFREIKSLKTLTIGNSITSIGEDAFINCSSLTELTIGNGVTSIGDHAFTGCSSLTELTIPNSVTSIGELAFTYCSSLTELTIGNSVTSIGMWAFYGCSGLTELTIPGSVTDIGTGAFFECSGLTELTIGNSVTSIGDSAFQGCSGLTTLYSLNTTPPNVSSWVFSTSHYTDVDLFVPAEALEAYQTADVWKEFQKLHGISGTTDIAKVSTAAEQIQSANGQITVTGLTDGTTVTVYDLSGQQVGTATSMGGQATVSTGMTAGAVAIVKVGERSVKVAVK